MAKTKHRIIATSISGFTNPIAKRRGAENIMIYAFKYVLTPKMRDWPMPIICNSNYFMVLKRTFDTTGSAELIRTLNDPENAVTLAIKAIVNRPHRRNAKRSKKQISRIYRNFKRARREGLFGDVDKSYDDAIRSICNATKEAFIITRKRIHPSVHALINKNEEVALPSSGQKHYLHSLYVKQENKSSKSPNTVYILEKEYEFDDAHAIQYKLSKESFKFYYKRRI